MLRCAALLLTLVAVTATGCGGSDDEDRTTATATATEAPAQEPSTLDEDALLAVHDELYECLRRAEVGVLASYADGRASVAESAEQPMFDPDLAAPEEEARLLDGGEASYIGLRANARRARDRGTPDWDVLIFPSDDAAAEALAALEAEADDAEQDGPFVRVVKRDGSGSRRADAESALTDCMAEARPG